MLLIKALYLDKDSHTNHTEDQEHTNQYSDAEHVLAIILILKIAYKVSLYIWYMWWQNLFMTYAYYKAADQPAILWSLVSAFVIPSLESIIPLDGIPQDQVSFRTWADRFESYLVTHLQRFSHDMAHLFELPHDKTNKMSVPPAKTQISLGIHPVWSVLVVCMKKPWVLSYPLSAQRRLWSDWADAQADLSLRWAHKPFCWFCHCVVFIHSNYPCRKGIVICSQNQQQNNFSWWRHTIRFFPFSCQQGQSSSKKSFWTSAINRFFPRYQIFYVLLLKNSETYS